MATQTNDKAAADSAVEFIAERVYGPAYFEKLASYGIVPKTDDDARYLLALGHELAEKAETQKAAAAKTPAGPNAFLKAAYDSLRGTEAVAQDHDARLLLAAIKTAAAKPELQNAALLFAKATQNTAA